MGGAVDDPARADDDARSWRFDWGDVRGELQVLGGMLGPVEFDLPSGRIVRPFAVAPWSDDPPAELAALPPILRHLRGEWPCVPFGVPGTRDDLPPAWMDGVDTSTPADDAFVHGYGSNHEWRLDERGEELVRIAIDYPEEHPVRGLSRQVRRAARGILELTLRIEMRRDATLPIGLHPVFALPERAGDARLAVPSAGAVHTFPVDVEPGVSILRADATVASLEAVPGKDGTDRDLTALPLPEATEELVLVAPGEGRVSLENRAGRYRATLSWDLAVFPRCLLWISNGGRTAYPWEGRFNALGIEPVAAPFDLGQRHAGNARSPLAGEAPAIAARLCAASPLETRYRIALEAL